MTFSLPSFLAALTSADIEVGPVLVRCVTFAQFTLDAPAVDEMDTTARLAIVAPATSTVPNFLFTSTFDYLRLGCRTTDWRFAVKTIHPQCPVSGHSGVPGGLETNVGRRPHETCVTPPGGLKVSPRRW